MKARNIKLEIDNKIFAILISILIIIALFFINYGHPIIEINNYDNCTEPSYPNYFYYTSQNINSGINKNNCRNDGCNQICCDKENKSCWQTLLWCEYETY